MYKTYQLKIKNTDEEYFNSLFKEAKWYYNTILASTDVFKFDTKSKIAFLTPEICQETKHLSSQMRQEIKKKLISSIIGLSKRKKTVKAGKLKFKSFVNSLTLKNQSFKLDGTKIKLQGYKKKFRVAGVLQLPENYKVASGILHRNPLGLYLLVTLELPDIEKIVPTQELGVDFGVKDSLVFSDGTVINTNFDTLAIRKTQKALSKKVRGSNNYKKCRTKLGVKHKKLDNRKKDLTNKLVNKLEDYKVYFQDEMISNWKKLFGKQLHNGILGRFKSALKKNPNNLMLSRIEPTTKLCGSCGALNNISLAQRTYACECGYKQHRDIHSARNMILIGSGRAYVEKKSDLFSMLSSVENKHFSLKQEAVLPLGIQ